MDDGERDDDVGDDDGTKRGADAMDRVVCEALSGGAFAVRFGASCELRGASRSLIFLPWQRIGLTERNSRRTAASGTHKPETSEILISVAATGSGVAKCGTHERARWQQHVPLAAGTTPLPSVRALDGVPTRCHGGGSDQPTPAGRPAPWTCGPFRLWIERFRFPSRLIAQVELTSDALSA
jgi:hypothetical protein